MRGNSFGKHPTQKPLALVERCHLASSGEGDLVLDPFAGSGTSVLACLRLGRRCVAVENDPGYAALAKQRIEAALAVSGVDSYGLNSAPHREQ